MKKLKTVIIEDELVSRLILEHYCFNHPDIEYIQSFDDIQEAVIYLEKEKTDLILLDIQLKNSVGFDLIPHLTAETRVIVTTGDTGHAEKAQAMQIGEVLLKPITLESFLLSVENIKKSLANH